VRSALALVVAAGCGNSLLPPGKCPVSTSGETVAVDLVALPGGGPADFDDMRYSPELGKVVAAPHGTGYISLIDPDTLALQNLTAPPGVESADASATTVYAADRANDRIVAIDIASGARVTAGSVPGTPDYVRFSPMTNEVWVSVPASSRIEIYDASTLVAIGSVTLPAPPEGLTFASGFAYTNANGRVTAVDPVRRLVSGEWETGCGYSHGFPQVDDAYQLAFGGCYANGGVGVVSIHGGERAGFEAGGGEAIVAYEPSRHHLYVRGDGAPTLDLLAVCEDGQLGVLSSVQVSNEGHGASADDRGHVWVADATTGGVFRVTDPFTEQP
jgi:DNA-binding beta-propeller fold protein YncE